MKNTKLTKVRLELCAGYALSKSFGASEETSQFVGNVAAMKRTGYFDAEWGATIGWIGGPGGAAIGAIAGGL